MQESQRALLNTQRELDAQTSQLRIAREAFSDALAEARVSREENAMLRGETERMRREYDSARMEISELRDELQRR